MRSVVLTRLFLAVLGLLVLLVIAGIVYEQLGERRDDKRYARVGLPVDIGGRTLNIDCAGTGSPTVILEGGYGWKNIQLEIARTTRVCWYDRAGMGWSDPGPYPRTASAIADDLHLLLANAQEQPPFVLVGASFSGFPVRVFAGKYKSEVAGLVLVDAVHEDQQEPDRFKSPANRLPAPVRRVLCGLLPSFGRIGLVRLVLHTRSNTQEQSTSSTTSDQNEYSRFLANLPKATVANGSEGCHWAESASEARAAGGFGNIPLIVLTAGRGFAPEDKDAAAFHENFVHNLQPQLAQLSTRGRQIIVPESGHAIQFEAPAAVVSAIKEVVAEVQQARGRQP